LVVFFPPSSFLSTGLPSFFHQPGLVLTFAPLVNSVFLQNWWSTPPLGPLSISALESCVVSHTPFSTSPSNSLYVAPPPFVVAFLWCFFGNYIPSLSIPHQSVVATFLSCFVTRFGIFAFLLCLPPPCVLKRRVSTPCTQCLVCPSFRLNSFSPFQFCQCPVLRSPSFSPLGCFFFFSPS